jgi:phosphinothricin acetyltransferase
MRVEPCSDADLPSIQAIINIIIATTTAIYDYKPRSMQTIEKWLEQKREAKLPVLGAYGEDGELLGIASYGPFRNWPAYKYSIEHSVYVIEGMRRKGVGGRLLDELVESALRADYHMMIGGIDSSNAASIRLHESRGFIHCGTVRHAGYKFSRWLDLCFYQRILETPGNPVEG